MKRAPGVLKKKKQSSTYSIRASETRSKRVMCEFGTFGVLPVRVAVSRLKSVRVWAQNVLKMLKYFLEAWRVSVRISSTRVGCRCIEYAFECARFRHASVRFMYMLIPILLDIASITCQKRV